MSTNKMEVKLEGLETLLEELETFPGKVERKYLRQALFDSAKPMEDKVKALAPVYSPSEGEANSEHLKKYPPGTLRNSVRLVARNARKGYVRVSLGVGPYYAKFIEYGTLKYSAKPFLRPSYDTEKNGILEKIKSGLSNFIGSYKGKRVQR